MSEKKYPSKMKLEELEEELEEAGIFPSEDAKKPDLVELVTELRGKEKHKRKKFHKIHGEYIEVIVRPVLPLDQGVDIFASVNGYTTQFPPNVPRSIPKGIAKFLKTECTVAQHYFDREQVSEVSGKAGVHTSRQVPKYVVEVVSEIL